MSHRQEGLHTRSIHAGRRRLRPIGRGRAFVFAWVLLAVAACDADAEQVTPTDSCEVLFGLPNEHTGLDSTECQPRCSCGGVTFEAPTYDTAFEEALLSDWVLAEPFAEIGEDPYATLEPAPEAPSSVCAVVPGGSLDNGRRSYTLVTYASEAAAREAGAYPTHFGACGVCSPLVDLVAYMREPDLTGPVRTCGLTSSDAASHVACLEALGFDRPCAQIWYWNTRNTRAACLEPCLAALNAPYHDENGKLNECLACDERESGAVFKAVAGRTRRNSGLPNAMCRPCSEVRPLVHSYPTD